MMNNTYHCDRLDEHLGAYLEGDLQATDRVGAEAHLASCLRCAKLVRDLEKIRREAAELPQLSPSRDLWSGIAARIETPVVTLDARRVTAPPAWSRWQRGIAAAALVAVTAGVTYAVTSWTLGADANRMADRGDSASPTNAEPTPARGPETAVAAGQQPDSTTAGSPRATNVAVRPTAPSAAMTYDQEIARLREIFASRRQDMDPATAAIVGNSLNTIDLAIAEARAALARDPNSRFLTEQLNKTLEKKLELLRTAALLPTRT
jgi:anti-sigma factor RsiW